MAISHGFRRHRRTHTCTASFSAFEADLLRSLAAQIVELLRSESATSEGVAGTDPLEQLVDLSDSTEEPEDPVLARLLPTAYPDDEEAAADFRRFTEGALRNGKVADASLVIRTLEEAGLSDGPEAGVPVEVELDREAGMGWMRALTDIRLALATRLGVEDDDEDSWRDLAEQDPRGQVHDIYQWVGFLQETLVEALG